MSSTSVSGSIALSSVLPMTAVTEITGMALSTQFCSLVRNSENTSFAYYRENIQM